MHLTAWVDGEPVLDYDLNLEVGQDDLVSYLMENITIYHWECSEEGEVIWDVDESVKVEDATK